MSDSSAAAAAAAAPAAADAAADAAASDAKPAAAAGGKGGKGGKKEKKVDERFVAERGTGIVKAVQSGDSLIVLQVDPKGAPKERRISLSNLEVPELASPKRMQLDRAKKDLKPGQPFDESAVELKSDEPFAFASREHLRKLVIGKQVTFVLEAHFPNRDYGFVFLPSAKDDQPPRDVGLAMVEAGFATVRESARDDPRPGMEPYLDAEDDAAAAKKGLHATGKARDKAVRALWQDSDHDTAALFDRLKGKSLKCVVEVVRSGSNLRVSLPSGEELNVFLSGIEAPERGQSFERESKFFAEAVALHRDAQLTLDAADRTSFYGTLTVDGQNVAELLLRAGLVRLVEWSAARSSAAKALHAAETAARSGRVRLFGAAGAAGGPADKAAPEGIKREIVGRVTEVLSPASLVVTENGGRTHRVFMSSVRAPRAPKPVRRPRRAAKKESGKAEEDGAAAAAEDNNSGDDDAAAAAAEEEEVVAAQEEEAPAPGGKATKAQISEQAWIDGKEALRAAIIGERVRCVFDYARDFNAAAGAAANKGGSAAKPKGAAAGKGGAAAAAAAADLRGQYSVYSMSSKQNLAVAQVRGGFAETAPHRGTEDRSKEYGDLLEAEAAAKVKKVGLWVDPEKATVRRARDLTTADADECKKFYPSLARAGRVKGVVEYVFSPSKLKVVVPKEETTIALMLTGVRTPMMKLQGGEPNPVAQAAIARMRTLVHQREIEFEVTGQDRTGSFIGNVFLAREKKPVAVALLEDGLAQLHMGSLSEVPQSRDFEAAEEGAKRKKLGMWESWDEEAEMEKRRQRRAERDAERAAAAGGADAAAGGKGKQEVLDVMVTEVIDGCSFFVQMAGKEADQLEALMAELQQACAESAEEAAAAAAAEEKAWKPTRRALVAAKFSADDQWYRAKVDSISKEGEGDDATEVAEISYIDYGNKEVVPTAELRKLDLSRFGADKLKPQAHAAKLAYLKVPPTSDDYGQDAAMFLAEATHDKVLMASVEYRGEDGTLYLSLGDKDSQQHIGAALLRRGLAQVERERRRNARENPVKTKLREEEDTARQGRLGIFAYGDPGDSDDEI